MAKRFSFRCEETPAWEVELNDAEHTVLHIKIPTKGLFGMVEALLNRLNTVSDAAADESVETIVNEIYAVAAELMSRNEEQIAVTADELGDKYNIALEDLINFFNGYIDFVEEVSKKKI